MNDELESVIPEGTPIHYPDQREPAEVRSGPVAPRPDIVNREELAVPKDLYSLLANAQHLRRLAVHWKADAAWPAIKDELERYEAQLEGWSLRKGSLAELALREIHFLLGRKPDNITERSTELNSDRHARCPSCGHLTDVKGFAEGNAAYITCGECFRNFKVQIVRLFISPPLESGQ